MAVAGEVRRTVDEVREGVRVEGVTTMADQVDASIVPERVIATLSGAFGALGTLLAAIGVYGLLAYTVARLTNEIGIRMAMGASRRSEAGIVLRDTLGMVLAGLAIGAPFAYWSENLAVSLVPGLPHESVGPIIVGARGIIAVALLAACVPARRAAKIDPIVALRCE